MGEGSGRLEFQNKLLECTNILSYDSLIPVNHILKEFNDVKYNIYL